MSNNDNSGKRMRRSTNDCWVAGVCSGIADYFGWNVNVFRLIYLLLSIFTAFSGVLVYIILWVLMPKE